MSDPENTTQPKEICTIRIGFPVDTDEKAIEYKRKIAEVLSPIPNVRIEFTLMPIPAMPMSPK